MTGKGRGKRAPNAEHCQPMVHPEAFKTVSSVPKLRSQRFARSSVSRRSPSVDVFDAIFGSLGICWETREPLRIVRRLDDVMRTREDTFKEDLKALYEAVS